MHVFPYGSQKQLNLQSPNLIHAVVWSHSSRTDFGSKRSKVKITGLESGLATFRTVCKKITEPIVTNTGTHNDLCAPSWWIDFGLSGCSHVAWKCLGDSQCL